MIVVTGILSDEFAAECIKHGAIDYLLKDKPEPLPSARGTGDRWKKLIAERAEAQKILRHSAVIVSVSDDAIVGLAMDETVTSWNHGAENPYGGNRAASYRDIFYAVIPAEDRVGLTEIRMVVSEGRPVRNIESLHHRRDGSPVSDAS